MFKRKIIIVLLAFAACILMGCNTKKDEITFREMNMDDQPYWNVGQHPVARGEKGYYYLKEVGASAVISYMDEATCNSTVLCSNAECTHDGRDCMAYMENGKYNLTKIYYYHGRIYLICNDAESGFCYLEEAAANGAYRKRLFEIGEYDEHGYSLIFHDDSVYMCSATSGLGFEESTTSIRKRSLDGKSDEIIYSHTGRGPLCYALKSYGDKLYFLVQDQEMEREGGGAKITIKRRGLYAYDYADKKVTTILAGLVCDYAIDVKEKVMYFYTYGYGLYKRDLETGNLKKLYSYEEGQTEMCSVSCDGNYIYLDNGFYLSEVSPRGPKEYTLYVMDKEGSIVNTIPSGWACMLFGDERYLFCNVNRGKPISYIKKSEIQNIKEWTCIDEWDEKPIIIVPVQTDAQGQQ